MDIINAERENYKIGKEISKLEKENETIDELLKRQKGKGGT